MGAKESYLGAILSSQDGLSEDMSNQKTENIYKTVVPMIFWRQSLFYFFRHLLYHMLIFWTRCSIFCFFDPPVCRSAGSAVAKTPPYETLRPPTENEEAFQTKAPANRGNTETQPQRPPQSWSSSSGAAGSTSLCDNRPRRNLKYVLWTMYYVLCTMYYELCTM